MLLHPGPSRTELMRYLSELAYRSSSARESLRERIHEPSIEVALRELQDFTTTAQLSNADIDRLKAAADVDRVELLLGHFEAWYLRLRAPEKVRMSQPWEWFPKARMMRRRFIFHCGPTNSGKTHEALEKLMKAKSGVYCAPLKALAAQVWKKIDKVVPCDLLIGDERQFGGCAEHVSCTLEMTPVDFAVDVGVIDEVQMVEDKDRGWAWTRAILGLPAREIHLCGEPRALEVVRQLLSYTNELRSLSVKEHKRLVPLQRSQHLRGSYSNVQHGDCVVVFSRKKIFEIRADILRRIPTAKVNIIYGAMPFAVREAESDAFNAGVEAQAGTNVLVTTDAIAYGLNMNIRRIVFSTVKKFDGQSMIVLPTTTILQVGGRAGRFGMKFSAEGGFVTTLHEQDFATVDRAFSASLHPIERVGLLPTADILAIYADMKTEREQRRLTFSQLAEMFVDEISVSGIFFPCDMTRSVLAVAKVLQPVSGLTLRDTIIFCFVPMSDSSSKSYELLYRYADQHAKGGPVHMEIDLALIRLLDGPRDSRLLEELEWIYRMSEVYGWLSWRFGKTFTNQEAVKALKERTVTAIKEQLA